MGDFDCLTEMASGKLYTYPDNFRADKIRAVAQISGFKLQVAPEYVHGVTNKTEEFQSKFFGKVPAFESGATALCDDTAIATSSETNRLEVAKRPRRSSVGLDSPKLTFFQLLPSGF